jgi:chemotaxis protein methyltransferase CheR
MDDAYPSLLNGTHAVDVIFCRNVLMYFTPEAMKKVVARLHRSLAPEGWLIVSPTETSCDLFSEFTAISFGDATLYQKPAAGSRISVTLPAVDDETFGVQVAQGTVVPDELTTASNDVANQDAPGNQADPATSSNYDQAVVAYEQGRFQDAEHALVAAISESPDVPSALLLLARVHANQRKLTTALTWCDKAIAADKMVASAYYLRSTILQEQGALPDALVALKQAVYVEPDFVLGHFTLGNIALKQRKLKESEKHFENALLLMARYGPEDFVPEAEGLSVGGLRQMIASSTSRGIPAVQTAPRTSSATIGKLELSKQ